MNTPFRIFICGLVVIIASAGCSTSEETGGSNRASQPEPEAFRSVEPPSQPVDTSTVRTVSPSTAGNESRVVPRVRSSQDTVKAATVRRWSRPVKKPASLVKPPNAMYTVQVGAFGRAPNALGVQRLVKKHFGTLPVFNNFQAEDKLYRVSIGKFETRKEASELRRRLLRSDSTSYAQCWVTYIKR